MLEVYLTAALICVASVLVGRAVLRLTGWEVDRGFGPAVGLTLLMAVASATIRLPGEDAPAVVACTALCVLAALVLRREVLPRPRLALVLAGVAVALATAIPFLVSERVGILGVSYNNDLAAHLAWTLSLLDDPTAAAPSPGYPLAPHALAATVAAATGADLDGAFLGLLVAMPVLSVPAAWALVRELPPARRALAAALGALPYLMAAYYVQSAFKETMFALLLVAFAAALRDLERREALGPQHVLPLLILAAGCVLDYSYGGLAWPVAIFGAWVVLVLAFPEGRARVRRLVERGRASLRRSRRPLLVAGAVAAAGLVLLIPEAPRLLDFFEQFGTSPAGSGAIREDDLGNLITAIPASEVFGLWPEEDFRFAPSPFLKRLLLALGLAASLYGLWWSLRRREPALPAAVGGVAVVYLYVRATESPYLAAKALAIAAPLVALLWARALLDFGAIPLPRARPVAWVAAAALVAIAVWSSVLALRGALVGPRDHEEQLAALRPALVGPTLFMGNDDYVTWELRGVPLSIPGGTGGSGSGPQVPQRKPWQQGDPVDFDSFPPATLDEFDTVVAPRTRFASEPPANFHATARTRDYVVYRRDGRTPPRLILAEGAGPGARFDCATPDGRRLSSREGWARIVPEPIVWRARQPIPLIAGATERRRLPLRSGTWELSAKYTSTHRLRVGADGRSVELEPQLERLGTFWPVQRVRASSPVEVGLRHEDPNPLPANSQTALLDAIAAVRTDRPGRLVPLREACGEYVDWYSLGADRPPLPRR